MLRNTTLALLLSLPIGSAQAIPGEVHVLDLTSIELVDGSRFDVRSAVLHGQEIHIRLGDGTEAVYFLGDVEQSCLPDSLAAARRVGFRAVEIDAYSQRGSYPADLRAFAESSQAAIPPNFSIIIDGSSTTQLEIGLPPTEREGIGFAVRRTRNAHHSGARSV